MAATLYRFTAAEGLTHLLGHSSSSSTPDSPIPGCEVHSVQGSLTLNGAHPTPSPVSTKGIRGFDHIVCDFDETITDHDTTSSFDTIAGQIRQEQHDQPELSWSEILQAYLDDLEKVDISDLCHLNTHNHNHQDDGLLHPQPQPSLHIDPRVRDLKCHTDGRKFTPEPELPTPKIPSLQPWIHSQVRKRAVEKISLDRVYESGNLVGMTKAQIRAYGRDHIRLRPGMVRFLKAFVAEQDRIDQKEHQQQPTQTPFQDQNGAQHSEGKDNTDEAVSLEQDQPPQRLRGELWIVSVNWSRDLIKGAMDQIFGSEEATRRYLPDANIISSNLQFSKECRDVLMKQRKAVSSKVLEREDRATAAADAKRNRLSIASSNGGLSESEQSEGEERLSNGKVRVKCLTGTDKLHAFQKIQRDYAAKHDLALAETKWAYFGDSTTDLGCLVEADVGIIIGHSKSLITECVRSGVQVLDIVEKNSQQDTVNSH
ncbi:hypothetical protein EMPS_03580 [Entomortierella parvispora]|uniref:Uncharacterized protein n=1 Tax=Entomortierella parvispora TaxID=205924 RepID=A0A9P3LV07_9FUNG|nr:hypothetical protein EMPS_03580 [Entomortierella parvispora]